MGNRPNIIFLMTDQQRFDAMGKVNPVVQTPNLDRLAGESVFFTNGYCTNPSCVPSRAAIMTGKYPSECQVPAFISKLPESETTFMTRLQRLGYYTAVVGKQHFAGSTISRGYDYEMIVVILQVIPGRIWAHMPIIWTVTTLLSNKCMREPSSAAVFGKPMRSTT